MTYEMPAVESMYTPRGEAYVVRDDLVPGGTKAAVLPLVFERRRVSDRVVYGSPAQGAAQVAIAAACHATGREFVIFTAERKKPHPMTQAAMNLGASVMWIPHGFQTVVQARAREWCARNEYELLPLGLPWREMEQEIALRAVRASAQMLHPPREVWCTAGSGTLSRALQDAWPDATHYAVQVGMTPKTRNAFVIKSERKFAQKAKTTPPFPSNPWYDAKAWELFHKYHSDGALFWNVA